MKGDKGKTGAWHIFIVSHDDDGPDEAPTVDVLHPEHCPMSFDTQFGHNWRCGIAFEIENGGYDSFFDEARQGKDIPVGWYQVRWWTYPPTRSGAFTIEEGPNFAVSKLEGVMT